jgi:hypothetical protein
MPGSQKTWFSYMSGLFPSKQAKQQIVCRGRLTDEVQSLLVFLYVKSYPFTRVGMYERIALHTYHILRVTRSNTKLFG